MAGNPDTIAAALRHLDLGFAVIPIKTDAKVPTMKDWAKHPVTNPVMAQNFLSNPGTQNYGLTMPPDSAATVVVLDLDDGDGATEPWKTRLRRQIEQFGPLPETKTTQTPSGGRHAFFAWPGKPPKGDQFLGWTLRVLNGRHQVLGPGSMVGGKPYIDMRPDANIIEMPETWIEAYREASLAPKATLRDLVEPHGPLITVAEASIGYEMPAAVTEGGRYAAIRDYVASRWNRGLSESELWALVRDELAPRFTVALTETELRERFDRTLKGIDSRLGAPAASVEASGPSISLSHDAAGDVKPQVANASSLIVPISTYRASVPTSVPWIVEPFAYLGGVTLLSGAPKAGKSSLSANLQKCRESNDLFLGSLTVPDGPTLLVTEEGGIPVVYKTEGLAALDVLDRKSAVGAGITKWVDVINVVADWAEAHPDALVFIDTLAIWAGLKDENDASAVTEALGYVATLAQARNCAVVLIHHTRKGGGDNGEAIRGSGAILATVDLSLELTRTEDNQSDDRWLDVQGRVVMPQRMRLAFDRATLTYTVIDADLRRAQEDEQRIVGLPMKVPGAAPTVPGMKIADIAASWGMSRQGATKIIDRMVRKGTLLEGVDETSKAPNKPKVYWAAKPEVRRAGALVRVGSTATATDPVAVDEE